MSQIVTESESTLGSIPYYIVENGAATKAKGTPVYTAVVATKESYGIGDVANRMAAEGCAVRPATISLVLSDFAELVAKLVAEGRAVNIGGVVRFAPAIRGTFASEAAAFDPAQHQVVVNATIGTRLRAAASTSSVQRIARQTLPELAQVYNMTTGESDTLCSQGLFMVDGTRLTWDDTQADEGFILRLNGVETKCTLVRADLDGKRLVLRAIQAMEAGDAPELLFRTRINGGLYQVVYGRELLCVEVSQG